MADLWLGLPGSEIKLPPIRALGASIPPLSSTGGKTIEVSKMADGTYAYSFYARRWQRTYTWGLLTASEFAILESLYKINQTLHFKDLLHDADWKHVVILSFPHELLRAVSTEAVKYYTATMVVVEAEP